MSYAIECKYLSEALETFYHQLILQKMKEDNISQLGDYNAPSCEQYTHGSCYISLFKFKSFDQFNTPQTASNFRHLLSCATIVCPTLSYYFEEDLNAVADSLCVTMYGL